VNPFLTAFLFGVAIATAVGPIALWIVHMGMTRGAAAGLGCAFGAALADLTYALLAFLAGASLAPLVERNAGPADMVARVALIAAGAWIIVGALRPHGNRTASSAAESRAGHESRALKLLGTTYLITLVNPLTLVAFVGFATRMPLGGSALRSVGLAVSLFLGSLAIQVVFALGGAGLGRLLADPRWIRGLNLVSGVALIVFGLRPASHG
jgi:threonine/homoserine/homoserine lactone efflux protein